MTYESHKDATLAVKDFDGANAAGDLHHELLKHNKHMTNVKYRPTYSPQHNPSRRWLTSEPV